jgi:hypothetical protein
MSSLLVILCLGWCSNFVGSESGQKQSVKLLQNMVYNTTQQPPPPHSHTLSVYTVHLFWDWGEGQREGRHKYSSFVHGGNSSEAESNTNHELMFLQTIKSVKQAAKSVNRSILRNPTCRVWCLYSSFVHECVRRGGEGGGVN